jgi:dUTP pyrophosphatase
MIHLRWDNGCEPRYMTAHSSGADVVARVDTVIPAHGRVAVPTGVWIDRVDHALVPADHIPEIQVRARSGLAAKHGIMLANGVGTVDADFPDEIRVILYNSSNADFTIQAGERIAQLVLALQRRFPDLSAGASRTGGFGSTGR